MAFSLRSVSSISQAAPGQQSILPGAAEGQQYTRWAQQGLAWLHGVRKLPWGRESCPEPEPGPTSLSRHPPCVPSGPRVCVPPLPWHCHPHPCLPVRLSTGMAKTPLVAPGQDRTPGTGWGSQAAPPRGWSQVPLAAAPSVVSEGTGVCVSSPTTVWCPPAGAAGCGTALGMPWGSSGCALARTPREEAVCIPVLGACGGWSCI